MIVIKLLLIIGFIIIFAYTAYAVWKGKHVPESISSSVYNFSKDDKWVFSVVMWMVGFMIAPYLFTIASNGTEFLVWWMIIGLLGVGIDPLEKDSKNIIHYVSAAICGVSSQILIFLNSPQILSLWVLYVPYTLIWEHSGKNMFFAEMIMIIGIMLMCI